MDEEEAYEVTSRRLSGGGAARWEVQASSHLDAVSMVGSNPTHIRGPLSVQEQLREMGQYVLEIAVLGGMPDSYFFRDERVKKAAAAMGMSVQQAYDWAMTL